MQARLLDLTHVVFEGKAASRRGGVALPRASARIPALPGMSAAEDPPRAGFARQVLTAAGIDPDLYRDKPVQRRVRACLRALRATSEPAAAGILAERPELLGVAVSSLLIGVTGFFRDAAVFEDLRTRVLPTLANLGRPLRIWSAGCSSGAEIYSLAMLLAEADLLERSQLLGTDCRQDALCEAETGIYPACAMTAVPDALRQRYLEQAGAGWRVTRRLRSAARWKLSDLSRDMEDGPWDLILCRNVTIYLNPEPALRLASRLAAAVAAGGYLVVGKAERAPEGAGLAQIARCIYRKGGHRDRDLD